MTARFPEKIYRALTIIDCASVLKPLLSFLGHYCFPSILMDIEWLLSTLFDASLL